MEIEYMIYLFIQKDSNPQALESLNWGFWFYPIKCQRCSHIETSLLLYKLVDWFPYESNTGI